MIRDSYASLEEWKSDYSRVQSHPNDKHLLAYVVKCVKNSSNTIQEEIKSYLANAVLETNPRFVLEQISKQYPNYFVLVKRKDNPWFDV